MNFDLKLRILSMAVGLASAVSAGTIGWWSMDGTPGQTAKLGDTFLNRVNPDVLPADVWSRYSGADATDYLPVYTNAFALPPLGGGVRAHGAPNCAGNIYTNASGIYLAAPANYSSHGKGCCIRVRDTPDRKLQPEKFTIEARFKTDFSVGGEGGWRAYFLRAHSPDPGGDANFNRYTYALWGDLLGGQTNVNMSCWCYVHNLETGADEIKKFFLGTYVLNDGKWHNVALTFSGAPNYKASIFIDGNWGATSDSLGGPLVYNDDEPLLIGGSSITSWQFRGCVDEARLSDEVIQNGGSWIESAMVDGETVGWFSFDGDYTSRVWNDYWTTAPTPSARDGGSDPTFVDDRPRASVFDGLGQRLVKTNGGSLDIAKGQVLWAKIPPIMAAATDGLTVEMFFKGNPAQWSSFVRTDYRYQRQSDASPQLFLPWNLGRNDGPMARFDTPSSLNNNLLNTTRSDAFDGKWHHLAITMENFYDESGAQRMRRALWLDYEKLAENTAAGWLTYRDGTEFGIGLATTALTGRIDELRITKGVLPSEKFLRAASYLGTCIIIR